MLPQLSVEYYDLLKAPYKKLIWFEGCGHSIVMYEQPEKFQQVVAEELMPFVPEAPKAQRLTDKTRPCRINTAGAGFV